MSNGRVACIGCGLNLPSDFENTPDFSACPRCLERLRVFSFPALHRASVASAGLSASEIGEASCFNHPQKQAVVACDGCGRFLCALCDVEIGDSHRCPRCLEAGRTKGRLEAVENRRARFDNIALLLATLPLLLWPFTLLTAPAAIFVVIRYWRDKRGVFPLSKIRFAIAFLFALAQICGWVAFFYFLASGGLARSLK